jgi:hypothetical protein
LKVSRLDFDGPVAPRQAATWFYQLGGVL